MTYSEMVVRQLMRLADLWKVWGLEGELKQLERSLASKEGNAVMAQALRNELGELKEQLSAEAHCAAEPERATPYSSGGCLEDACACRPWS